MKDKWDRLRSKLRQCRENASMSTCILKNRQFGAMLLEPETFHTLLDAYNGGPMGGDNVCGGDRCLREQRRIPSGTCLEVGCHHAEQNLICFAARFGVPTKDKHLIVTGEPCLMCAKMILASGITCVYYVDGGYSTKEGILYLNTHNVITEAIPQG